MALARVGALWLNKSKTGRKFMSGKIGDAKVMVFKNEKKSKEGHPDYNISLLIDEDLPPDPERSETTQDEDDEIPF